MIAKALPPGDDPLKASPSRRLKWWNSRHSLALEMNITTEYTEYTEEMQGLTATPTAIPNL